MKRLALMILLLVILTGGIILALPKSEEAKPKLVAATPTVQIRPPTRQELLNLTNKARTDNGLPALTEDPRLDTSAQQKADDETKYNYFDHVSPHDGKHGYEYAHVTAPDCYMTSENITDNIHVNDASTAMYAWLHSPTHKAAILSPHDISVGFGISGYHIVQHFCLSK